MSEQTEALREFKRQMRSFVDEAPEVQAFQSFIESTEETSTLDHKTKELLSLAIGVALRCDPCILWHTKAALDAGASREEIDDVLTVAVAMGGGPALAYATKAHQTMLELAE